MTDQELLSNFKRNPDGSWSPLRQITVNGVTMSPGVSFGQGVSFGGIDIAQLCNEAARRNPTLVRAV